MPIGIAFGGGLSGLVFLAKGFGHIWIYSLMSYGMSSSAPQKITERGYLGFVIICIIYIIGITAISGMIFTRREFKN